MAFQILTTAASSRVHLNTKYHVVRYGAKWLLYWAKWLWLWGEMTFGWGRRDWGRNDHGAKWPDTDDKHLLVHGWPQFAVELLQILKRTEFKANCVLHLSKSSLYRIYPGLYLARQCKTQQICKQPESRFTHHTIMIYSSSHDHFVLNHVNKTNKWLVAILPGCNKEVVMLL